jgi:two-component system, OmpR family, sensor histidine kinase VanS
MTAMRSPLARRIALMSGATFIAISALVLIAQWSILTAVTSASIVVEPAEAGEYGPQVVEAVFRLASDATNIIMLASAAALLAITVIGTSLSYRAATVSLRRVADVDAHTRRITANTLDERLNLRGPRDEIKNLADTIDYTLGKLEAAFGQQERFAANASHELRTPLTVLRTSLEGLAAQGFNEDENVQRSLRSVMKMDAMIDSLLLLSQTRQLPVERRYPVDLAAILRVSWEETRADFRARHIDASIHAEGSVYTAGDHVLLIQAVHNLLQNAARYTPIGGKARFEVTVEAQDAVMSFTNDCGNLPDDDLARLLEPFHRGTESRLSGKPGHGLGLSIVHSIAQQHGGTFTLSAEGDHSLTATLRFALNEGTGGGTCPPPVRPQSSGEIVVGVGVDPHAT